MTSRINHSTNISEISLESLQKTSIAQAAVVAKTFDVTQEIGKDIKVVVVLVDKANALLSPMGQKQDETIELLKTIVERIRP